MNILNNTIFNETIRHYLFSLARHYGVILNFIPLIKKKQRVQHAHILHDSDEIQVLRYYKFSFTGAIFNRSNKMTVFFNIVSASIIRLISYKFQILRGSLVKTANETATGLLGGSGFKYSASPSMRLINPIYFRKQSVTNPISNNVRMILNYV